MVWLTGLATIMRRTGYPVVEVAGWRTRGYKGRGLDAVRGIVPHHTATPWSRQGDYPSLALVRDGRSDLPGPLAQLGLGRSGTWYIIAAGWANHAGLPLDHLVSTHSNRYAIGIEAEAAGTGDPRDWPAPQMDSYARGCKALCDAFGVPVGYVLGHKEMCKPRGRKSDPSFDMGAFRVRVSKSSGSVTPTPPEEVEDVVTAQDRTAIAAEAAAAVTKALAPAIARAEDEAVAARRAAEQATAAATQAVNVAASALDAVGQHEEAEALRHETEQAIGDDRYARRDRFNTREYGTPGVDTYTELAQAGSYDTLSGSLIRLPTAS